MKMNAVSKEQRSLYWHFLKNILSLWMDIEMQVQYLFYFGTGISEITSNQLNVMF